MLARLVLLASPRFYLIKNAVTELLKTAYIHRNTALRSASLRVTYV